MIEWVVSAFMLIGAVFMLLAAIGLIRLPDLPTRMHASTKSGVLGSSLIMIGVMLSFLDTVVTFRALAIIVFLMITTPVAAHVIGRAGYFVGVNLWEGTVKDMLKESYDPVSHQLRSGFEAETDGERDPQRQDTPERRGDHPTD